MKSMMIVLLFMFAIPVATSAQSATITPLSQRVSSTIKSRPGPHAKPDESIVRTPEGLAKCLAGPGDEIAFIRRRGETMRYTLDVNGLSVGTLDFKTIQTGMYAGRPVTEYRSNFNMDGLIAAAIAVEGRAASIVPLGRTWPIRSMNRYRVESNRFEEEVQYGADGAFGLVANRSKNGTTKMSTRQFVLPPQDFISGFYLLRALPEKFSGCTLIYGNGRVYTVWLRYEGTEKVTTPVGLRSAETFALRYASENHKQLRVGRVWRSLDSSHLLYRVEIEGQRHMIANLHLYEPGVAAAQ